MKNENPKSNLFLQQQQYARPLHLTARIELEVCGSVAPLRHEHISHSVSDVIWFPTKPQCHILHPDSDIRSI